MTTATPEVPLNADPTLLALTVEEAARRLSIGRTTMYALIRTGEIKSVPIGRLRRVPAEECAAYLRRRMEQITSTPIAA